MENYIKLQWITKYVTKNKWIRRCHRWTIEYLVSRPIFDCGRFQISHERNAIWFCLVWRSCCLSYPILCLCVCMCVCDYNKMMFQERQCTVQLIQNELNVGSIHRCISCASNKPAGHWLPICVSVRRVWMCSIY